MGNLIDYFRRWFRRDSRKSTRGQMAPNVPQIMRQLEATHAVELPCDEILRLMDECAEAAVRGEDISALMPLFQRHLDMCADCREEFEGLLRILRARPA